MKLSEIAKMPAQIKVPNLDSQDPYYYGHDDGYNKAISECSNIEVEADVEKLANILREPIKNPSGIITDVHLHLAQEIITKMPEWIVK